MLVSRRDRLIARQPRLIERVRDFQESPPADRKARCAAARKLAAETPVESAHAVEVDGKFYTGYPWVKIKAHLDRVAHGADPKKIDADTSEMIALLWMEHAKGLKIADQLFDLTENGRTIARANDDDPAGLAAEFRARMFNIMRIPIHNKERWASEECELIRIIRRFGPSSHAAGVATEFNEARHVVEWLRDRTTTWEARERACSVVASVSDYELSLQRNLLTSTPIASAPVIPLMAPARGGTPTEFKGKDFDGKTPEDLWRDDPASWAKAKELKDRYELPDSGSYRTNPNLPKAIFRTNPKHVVVFYYEPAFVKLYPDCVPAASTANVPPSATRRVG